MLGGIFSSLFGGGSTQSTNNPAASVLGSDANQLSNLNKQQLGFESGLEGQRENGINDLIQQNNPAGLQSNINQFGAGAQENAGNSARNLGLFNAGQGIGSATTSGQAANLFNNANSQTNQYAAQVNSPQARSQQLQQMLSAVMQGQNPSSMSQELQLYNPLQQTAQFGNQLNQQNNQFLNSVLGSVGSVLGGSLGGDALGGILGGSGGSGGSGGLGGFGGTASVPNVSGFQGGLTD